MCKIISFYVPLTGPQGQPYANGMRTTQSQCLTHSWSFPSGEPMGADTKCPIGRIEEATAEALEKIAEAKRDG